MASMQSKRSRLLRIGKHFSPGVKKVQAQVQPYAEAWKEANFRASTTGERIWVVLGDSMSQGIGASMYDKGWVGQAGALLRARGSPYRIINLSSSGARITDVLSAQLPAMNELPVKPALVTVLIGSNDLITPTARPQLLSNLEKLLMRLPEGSLVGDVFGRPSTPRLLKYVFTSDTASSLLARLARRRNLTVVPLNDAFKPPWSGKLASDRFHPNDEGYKGIAEAFVSVIKR